MNYLKIFLASLFLLFSINAYSENTKLTNYESILKNLPADNLNSVLKAKNTYLTYFSINDDVETREKSFCCLLDFINKITENLNSEKTEGDLLKKPEYNSLYNEFNNLLSPASRAYLQFKATEEEEGFLNDGGIIISWDKMRKRIIYLENLKNKFPTFCYKEFVEKEIQRYLFFYLAGSDNSSLTDDFKNSIKSEIKRSYSRYISINRNSYYCPLILDYYTLLKKNNFKPGNYINIFFKTKSKFVGEEFESLYKNIGVHY